VVTPGLKTLYRAVKAAIIPAAQPPPKGLGASYVRKWPSTRERR
jgi:hypothetical protein